MVRSCYRVGLVVLSAVVLFGLLPGCSSGNAPPEEAGEESLQESAEQAAPPGMGDALRQMYEGGEMDEEAAQTLFQSGAMMPQGYPTEKAGQQR